MPDDYHYKVPISKLLIKYFGSKYALCSEYYRDVRQTRIIGNCILLVIFVVNYLLQTIIMIGVKNVKFDSVSEQYVTITNTLFVA